MTDGEAELESVFQKIDSVLKSGDPNVIVSCVDRLLEREDLHTITRSMLVNAGVRYRNHVLLHNAALRKIGEKVEMANVQLPVGIVSHDGSAILGRDGYVFLIGGSNDVIGQYSPRQGDVQEYFDRWIEVIASRHAAAAARGVRYHQIIIPEKISIIPEHFPEPVATPTRLLERLEFEYTEQRAKFHTSGRLAFWKENDRSACCKKMDSHLSPRGSLVLFQALMKALYDKDIPAFSMSRLNSSIGDLTFRLLGLFVAEEFYDAGEADLPAFVDSAIKVNETRPEGGHVGLTQIWKNDQAPITEKVVVFGNSFFSSVENGQSTLSWWFSRWFSEFHFVWTNEVRWDYIDEVKPHLVLWQGIERFLPVIPGR